MLPPMVSRVYVVCAMPLFSTTTNSGACHTDARFMLSYTSPWPSVPSPIMAATSAPLAFFLRARASPALIPIIPACTPLLWKCRHARCWLPPRPRQTPASRPMISATRPRKVARIGQKVTVVAMIGQHRVLGVIERAHDRKGGDLLAEAGVRGAGNQPARELIEDELLGQPDQVTIGIEVSGSRPMRGLPWSSRVKPGMASTASGSGASRLG